MYEGGELAVHNNVTFEANAAEDDGGAVSLPFNSIAHPSGGVGVCTFCENLFDSR